MYVTDAHVHIWTASTPEKPWQPVSPDIRVQREEPLEVDELIARMDAAGVDRAVVVPPGWTSPRNDVVTAAAERYPDRIATTGVVDLKDSAATNLSNWFEQPGMLGLRISLAPSISFQDIAWLWPQLAKFAIPTTIRAPGDLPLVGEVARRYPQLKIIIDHLGLATQHIVAQGYPDIGPMIEPLVELSVFDNIGVKVSLLPNAVKDDYPFPTLAPHVRRIVDAFGAERCMWGSDLSQLKCPYEEWVAAASNGLGCLTPAESEWLMSKSLSKWLNWPEPT